MKVGIKKGKGKLVGGEKLGETIVAKTKIKGKNSGKDVGQVLRPLDIPLFSPRVMTVEVEKDKCKLSDYRKLYGSKYVRLERNWQKEELIGQFDNDQ